ncbi:unnamed protein product [Pleuronectes platessa]|uniref:Uncharacterized protein n=1 Tax=Pleuronectes platessa TaxID=8262 RepID=A0A9N7UUE9_PLEPL|nr:unnamed protein product [Pleuronectes platessa]
MIDFIEVPEVFHDEKELCLELQSLDQNCEPPTASRSCHSAEQHMFDSVAAVNTSLLSYLSPAAQRTTLQTSWTRAIHQVRKRTVINRERRASETSDTSEKGNEEFRWSEATTGGLNHMQNATDQPRGRDTDWIHISIQG